MTIEQCWAALRKKGWTKYKIFDGEPRHVLLQGRETGDLAYKPLPDDISAEERLALVESMPEA